MSIIYDNDQTYHYRSHDFDEKFQRSMDFFEKQVQNQMNFWKIMFITGSILTTIIIIGICIYCIRMNRQQHEEQLSKLNAFNFIPKHKNCKFSFFFPDRDTVLLTTTSSNQPIYPICEKY